MYLLEIEDRVNVLGYGGTLEYYYIGENGQWVKPESDDSFLKPLAVKVTPN